jgi:hypothetical protein
MGLYDRLEPFGAGNPKPGLALRGAELRWGPEPRRRKSDGTTWALAGGFALSGESGLLFAEWADPPRAADLWTRGGRYDLILAPTRSAAKGKGSPEKIWHGWRVLDADRA